jgi:drug/metabolite transporter (DMT)-like permease
MSQIAYALAVLSSITYGAADFCGGLASRKSAMFSVVVFSQLAGLVLLLFALPVLPPSSPTATDFAWGAAAGLAGGIGVALLYKGLAIGTMSVVAPVTAVCAVIIPLIVGVALGERPSTLAIAGVGLGLVAIVLVSQSKHEAVSGEHGAGKSVGIAVASGVLVGIFFVLLGRTGPPAGRWPLLAARMVSVGFFTTLGTLTRRPLIPIRESMPIILVGGTLDMLANVLYLLAVRQGYLSIVATLASLYPASTVILARFVLGERQRAQHQCGVACAVLAIVLIVRG